MGIKASGKRSLIIMATSVVVGSEASFLKDVIKESRPRRGRGRKA